MNDFSEIKRGDQLVGLLPDDKSVWVVATEAVGENALSICYKDEAGALAEQIIYKNALPSISHAQNAVSWSFAAPPAEFKLALEALRMKLGALFDPMMAIHSSNIEPLPHQIAAVYESMLPKQPLRFVLADDPGAGKTIMAGLLIKELIMRSDAQRVLIVAPGSLTEQWQDELLDKFALSFKIFSAEEQEMAAAGNYFAEQDLLIARLDQIARNEDYAHKLEATRWDLVIVDEAHKMAAHFVNDDVKKTQRYKLGELLGRITRHYLLMTATPHNGNEADFQLWLSLLDEDRFFSNAAFVTWERTDTSGIMRRMVKEKLLRFDGTRLFPERRADTLHYQLSPQEQELYERVTKYVVCEMNRAGRLDKAKGNKVGFALTILQRRLASSPAAIFKSLDRRLTRLEKTLEDLEQRFASEVVDSPGAPTVDGDFVYYKTVSCRLPEDLDELDDEMTSGERENISDELITVSAAKTKEELAKEIETLRELRAQALDVYNSGRDCKWNSLSELLRTNEELKGADGRPHKLIIFTEHKDTLEYLRDKITGLLGREQAVRTISGSTRREDRRQIQEDFCNDPTVLVLIGTDAAGEGINLQRAHLLINYDLPWNPNRLEQRFGRIHRIGQTETCRMWNMVAKGTREGQVFDTLFEKLEIERQALGGQVFDILGEAFKEKDKSLKDLLVAAIKDEDAQSSLRYMSEQVEEVLNHEKLKAIMQNNMLVEQAMSKDALFAVKAELDKAEARKLQPYFVRSFFKAAFTCPFIGGRVTEMEARRYSIRNVPSTLIELNKRELHTRTPLVQRYERVCFEKELINTGTGAPRAEFMHPGHPLMQTLIHAVLKEYRALVKTGSVLVARSDDSITPYLVTMVRHAVSESDSDRVVSERLQFVRINPDGSMEDAGWAPHLDYNPPEPDERDAVQRIMEQDWLKRDWEKVALKYAAENLAKEHFEEVGKRRAAYVEKLERAVVERLDAAISQLHAKALKYEAQIRQGGTQANAQPFNARGKAGELAARKRLRREEFAAMRHLASRTPVVLGSMLVVPQGYLNQASGSADFCADAEERRRIEQLAMVKVMEAERALGFSVTDVSAQKLGWDVTSQPPARGDFLPDARHIEVKGKAKGSTTVTITRNEITTALNQQQKYILAIVLVDGDNCEGPFYIPKPFSQELADNQISGNFSLSELISRSVAPEQSL